MTRRSLTPSDVSVELIAASGEVGILVMCVLRHCVLDGLVAMLAELALNIVFFAYIFRHACWLLMCYLGRLLNYNLFVFSKFLRFGSLDHQLQISLWKDMKRVLTALTTIQEEISHTLSLVLMTNWWRYGTTKYVTRLMAFCFSVHLLAFG